MYELMFFCSSRRLHTRWPRDWSSDVCSSDLEPRSTKPALRTVEVDHGLLYRVQGGVRRSHALDGPKRPAIQGGQKPDTRIDGPEARLASGIQAGLYNCAGTAVTFGTAFFGAGQIALFAQKLQYRCGWFGCLNLLQGTVQVEPNRAALPHGCLL